MTRLRYQLLTITISIPLIPGLLPMFVNLLPLMTRLFICEFGFILSGFGIFQGIQHIRSEGTNLQVVFTTFICIVLLTYFLLTGIALWPTLANS